MEETNEQKINPNPPVNTSGKIPTYVWIIAAFGGIIPIIAILAAIVVLIINPLELTRRGRDATRFADLALVQQAINLTVEEASSEGVLCGDIKDYCEGKSNQADAKRRRTDGTGWVKIDLTKYKDSFGSKLPVDPINSEAFFYRYCADGMYWELNIPLESEQQKIKATEDDGDNQSVYEIGSKLDVCK